MTSSEPEFVVVLRLWTAKPQVSLERTEGAVMSVVEVAGMISEGSVPTVPLRIRALELLEDEI